MVHMEITFLTFQGKDLSKNIVGYFQNACERKTHCYCLAVFQNVVSKSAKLHFSMPTLELSGKCTAELTFSVLVMNQVYVFTEPGVYSSALSL